MYRFLITYFLTSFTLLFKYHFLAKPLLNSSHFGSPDTFSYTIIIIIYFAVLEIELKVLCLLGKDSTT
jgi:hypothetical protein